MGIWTEGAVFPQGWGESTLLNNATVSKVQGTTTGSNAIQIAFTSALSSEHSRINTPYFNVSSGVYKLTYYTKGNYNLRWVVLSPRGIQPGRPSAGSSNLQSSDYDPSGNKISATEWTKREATFDVPNSVSNQEYCIHFSYNSTVEPDHFSITNVSLELVEETPVDTDPWQSDLVKMDNEGNLTYFSDPSGFRIPDFGSAGYQSGLKEIPHISVVKEVSPIEGDNTTHIQNAINEVGSLPLVNGVRGAILFKAGTYPVSGSINLNKDGVIIRGEGNGNDPSTSTIFLATGTSKRNFLVVGNNSNPNNWTTKLTPDINITDEILNAGDDTIMLETVDGLAVGDQIVVFHPKTQAWLDAIEKGVSGTANPWTMLSSFDLDIMYNRYITEINPETKKITIDAPVYYTLNKSLSQSYVYKMSRHNTIREVGVENLRLVTEFDPSVKTTTATNGTYFSDENHAQDGIRMNSVENGWVKNVVIQYFGSDGIITTNTTRSTIIDCQVLDPVSKIDGGERYGFNTSDRSQQILFKNLYSHKMRHGYISNGKSTASGIVFQNCVSDSAYAASEGHRWWSQGFLFDNYKELEHLATYERSLAFYNRGNYGTSHGWSIVTAVAWNCDLTNNKSKGHLLNQKPPTGQNFAIGTKARVVNGSGPFAGPAGYIEGTNRLGELIPQSLYDAQLNVRKKKDALTGISTLFSKKKSEEKTFKVLNTQGEVKLNFIAQEAVNLAVYNSTGIFLKKIQAFSNILDLSEFPKGMYFLRILE